MKKKTASYWLFLLGLLVFYIVPFGYSLWYAVTDNIIDQNFVGLKNFADTLSNSLFQGAAFNSAVFMVVSVPLGMAIALVLSICLQKMKRGRVIATMALLLPLVVPSGTIVYFWKVLFDSNGLVNELLLQLGLSHPWVSQHQWPLGVLVVIFLMLRYTKFGRALYAVGGSEQSAAMMGLNVKATKMKAYVLSSFLCSIGGICYCMNTMSASVNQATGLEMDAIASSVIGGTLLTGGVGNVIGTLFGVLINGTIASIVQFNGRLASSWPNVLTAALLCFFIVLQSIFAKIKERNK